MRKAGARVRNWRRHGDAGSLGHRGCGSIAPAHMRHGWQPAYIVVAAAAAGSSSRPPRYRQTRTHPPALRRRPGGSADTGGSRPPRRAPWSGSRGGGPGCTASVRTGVTHGGARRRSQILQPPHYRLGLRRDRFSLGLAGGGVGSVAAPAPNPSRMPHLVTARSLPPPGSPAAAGRRRLRTPARQTPDHLRNPRYRQTPTTSESHRRIAPLRDRAVSKPAAAALTARTPTTESPATAPTSRPTPPLQFRPLYRAYTGARATSDLRHSNPHRRSPATGPAPLLTPPLEPSPPNLHHRLPATGPAPHPTPPLEPSPANLPLPHPLHVRPPGPTTARDLPPPFAPGG